MGSDKRTRQGNGRSNAAHRIGRGIGYGKVILLGEHFVVYGAPALVLGIKELNVEIELGAERSPCSAMLCEAFRRIRQAAGIDANPPVKIIQKIPRGQNLGSSAALCVAYARALSDYFGFNWSDEKINALAYEGEKVFHGRPSGIDNTAATYGGFIRFQRGRAPKTLPSLGAGLVIAKASDRRKSTKELVMEFAERKKKSPWVFSLYERMFEKAIADLYAHDLEGFGRWMEFNHHLLAYFGMSTPEVEDLRYALKDLGALGVKITGAGQGGNLIALFPSLEAAQEAAKELRGRQTFVVKV